MRDITGSSHPAAASSSDQYELSVVRCGPSPEATLVVTDADGLLGMVVDTIELMRLPGLVPDLLVIGIGYPEARSIQDTVSRRLVDLTPTPWARFPGSGGGPAFARFLESTVLPLAAREVPDGTVHFLGHSLGGMFGTWLLLTDHLFDGYILGSPSLWWRGHELLDHPVPDTLRARVFVGIGALETDAGRRAESANLPADHPDVPPSDELDMVADLERWVARMQSRPPEGLDLEMKVFADEYHVTVIGPVVSHGLRFLFEHRHDVAHPHRGG